MRNIQVRAANELLYRLVDLEQHGKKTMINFVHFMGKIFNICRHGDLFLLVLG